MITKLKQSLENLVNELEGINTKEELNDIKIKYLGRKSDLIVLLRSIKELPEEERAEAGRQGNQIKKSIESLIEKKSIEITNSKSKEYINQGIDITYPGKQMQLGKLHPITQMYDEVVDVFRELGFTIWEGPDIVDDWHCFEMLRMPKDHPARDSQDTYYIEKDRILPRTHTSAAQSRAMIQLEPPIKVLVPGRCYRNEKVDPRHTDQFYQFEGLVLDENASVKDLKATLTEAFRRLLNNNDIEIRFRHNHFPYTEPSIEVDATCINCNGKGCPYCSKSGWIELCGAGFVHPEVLENFGIDSEKYQGYAFGPGIERFVALKHKIPDARLMLENDIRTLKQF